jgi:hypothetical protein
MAKAGSDRALEMATLVAAVEHGGFSAAARVLNVTPSAVSKPSLSTVWPSPLPAPN